MSYWNNEDDINTGEYSDKDFFGEADNNTEDDIFSRAVSGVGIGGEYEDTPEEDITDLLKNMNAQNIDQVKAEEERLEQLKRDQEYADWQKREEAKARRLAEAAEEERIERERLEAEEAERQRLYEEELEAKRQNSVLAKAGKFAGNLATNLKAKSDEKKIQREEQKLKEQKEKELKKEKELQEKKELEEKRKELEEKKKQEAEEKAPKEQAKQEAKSQKEPVETTSTKEEAPVTKKKQKPEKVKPGKAKPETKKKETSEGEDWEYIATHDEMTKLKNIRAYEMDKKKCNLKETTIIYFDVNNLKFANDNFGHSAGNRLLIATGEELTKLFEENAYRTGGDEFIVLLKEKQTEEKLKSKLASFQKAMNEHTKSDTDGLVFAVSVGYAIGDGKKTIEDLEKEADTKMYANKKAYKQSHPKLDARKEKKEPVKAPPADYDSLLSKEQQTLKTVIKENHSQATEETTENILCEVQRRCSEVLAILIASPTFDHLFIIQDVNSFTSLLLEGESIIDYSYFYVVYEGGPQYYGTDEYYNEVTHIFEAVAEGLKNGHAFTEKDIKKIKGINIFKEIYIE